MQAFACDEVRAFTKLGMAIAANRPIMATTIIISTRVNPERFDVLIFILLFASFCGVNRASGGLLLLQSLFTHCLMPPLQSSKADAMPLAFEKKRQEDLASGCDSNGLYSVSERFCSVMA